MMKDEVNSNRIERDLKKLEELSKNIQNFKNNVFNSLNAMIL